MFDDLQAQLAANRSEFYRALPSGPFYNFDKPGVAPSEAIIENWWRQGMMGDALSHYDGIVAFSQTDFTEDLKKITIPTLVMHSTDDQIVPYVAAGPKSAELLQNGTLKTYRDNFPHGMPTTHADVINADLPRLPVAVTHVSTVCIHRDIDVPSGDLHDIVEKLSELSERECRADGVYPVDDQALEYSATVDVFDVPGGRVLVRWTASLPVPDGRTDAVKALRTRCSATSSMSACVARWTEPPGSDGRRDRRG